MFKSSYLVILNSPKVHESGFMVDIQFIYNFYTFVYDTISPSCKLYVIACNNPLMLSCYDRN